MTQIIDLSYNLDESTPPFPGDGPVDIDVVATIPHDHPPGEPGPMNISQITTGLHVGTHMDAPFHFYHKGQTIEQIALERCMGLALLLDFSHKNAKEEITHQELAGHEQAIRQIPKVILNMGWAKNWKQPHFFTEYPTLSGDAARFLIACGVDLVGVDTPSVDYAPYPVHFPLLGNDVLIVENLTNLDQIQRDQFHFMAFPLKITGRDASPVRAVAVI